MKKTSFVVAILASALLAGACHKKKDTANAGSGSAMGSDMGSGSAMGSDMGSGGGSAMGSGSGG